MIDQRSKSDDEHLVAHRVRASGRYKTRYKTPIFRLKIVNDFNMLPRDRRNPLGRTTP
jgi:hypothetical protein